MARLDTITVNLKLPFLGQISGTWAPDEVERDAAWEMYVELATRIAIAPLAPGEGMLREALTSLHSLFASTRDILREHGPRIARPSREGDIAFAYLALAVLNGALRPLLTRWHPELTAYEQQRPPGESVVAWERAWPYRERLSQQIETTRQALLNYADVLAQVADVPPLHS